MKSNFKILIVACVIATSSASAYAQWSPSDCPDMNPECMGSPPSSSSPKPSSPEVIVINKKIESVSYQCDSSISMRIDFRDRAQNFRSGFLKEDTLTIQLDNISVPSHLIGDSFRGLIPT